MSALGIAVPEPEVRATPARRMVTRRCLECGQPFRAIAAQTPAQEFCCPDDKRKFNNRRMLRGALVYDFLMASRYERGLAKTLKAWGALCRLAQTFREEDVRERAGRRSWRNVRAVIWERPWLSTVIVSRNITSKSREG